MSLYSQMMTFIAVVETQSFTRAAVKLSVSPTAVSKQIKQLEAYTKQQLLERNTRTVKITEIGQQFYDHCKRVSREVVAADEFIHAQSTEPRGQLRILCSMIFATTYLVHHLQKFYQRYPLVQLFLEFAERIPDMERENFDILVGFSMLPQIPTQLRHRKLITTRYVLCASPHYLKQHGTPKVAEDLKNHQFLNHPLRQPIDRISFKNGNHLYMPFPEIIINNMDALITLASNDAGIVLATEMQVHSLLQQKKLIRLLPDLPWDEVTIYLFYRSLPYEQRKVRCFIDFCLELIH